MHFVFVIPLITFLFIAGYCILDRSELGDTIFFSAMSGILSLLICFLIALLGGALFSSESNKGIHSDNTTALIALQDGNLLEGRSFFLGSGYVDEELKYTYMYLEEGKGYTVEQVNADWCYINYIVEGEQPYIREIIYEFDNDFLNFMFIAPYSTEYYIYIPEGSITQEYRIDLQ